MTSHAINFTAAEVRAVLDASMTQFRRIVKLTDSGRVKAVGSHKNWHVDDTDAVNACPFGAPGDQLWVRETFAIGPKDHGWGHVIYKATFGAAMKPVCEGFTPWKPSTQMPRWASRITLEVVDVRVVKDETGWVWAVTFRRIKP